jgi:hypothetical protein
MAASFSAGLVAFSHLQFSQIRGPPAHLFVRKIPYVILAAASAEVEVRSYSFGVLSNALNVVKAGLTIFHHLADTIELQGDLQIFEAIYLRDQPRPYFLDKAIQSAQFRAPLLKIIGRAANLRGQMHLRAHRKVANGDLLFVQCHPGFRIRRQPTGCRS